MARDALRMQLFIPGDQAAQINHVLTRGAAAVTDWRPAWEDIATLVEDGAVEQFRTEGARGGAPWQDLTIEYDRAKTRRWGVRPLLVASGKGYGAVANRYDPNHVRKLDAMEMRVGADDSAVPYMKYHQSGTLGSFQSDRRGPSGMPRRRPMFLTKKDRVDVLRRLQKHAIGWTRLSEALGAQFGGA